MMLFSCLAAVTTCAARQPNIHTPDLIEQAQVLAQRDPIAAIEFLEDRLNNPDPALEPWALLWAGEHRRLIGDYDRSRHWFHRLTTAYPDHSLNDAAIVGMIVIDADNGVSEDKLIALESLDEDGLPNSLNADRFRILARAAADDGASASTVRGLVRKAIAYAGADNAIQYRINQTLSDLLTHTQSDQLSDVSVDESDSPTATLTRARTAYHAGNYEIAQDLADRFIQLWPNDPKLSDAEYLVRLSQRGDVVDPTKIGVLLPLTGQYAPAATRLRQAIEMASEASDDVIFVFADTGGDPTMAVTALETLTLEEGCIGVMGPLLKEVVIPVSESSQALNIPLIALSQSEDPTASGDFVFRGFLPLSQQVETLAAHSINDLQIERFAILYPDNSYGKTARSLFEAAVLDHGAEISRTLAYDPSASVFLEPARLLGEKTESSADDDHRDHANNPPLIDYEALFIPDNHQRVALIASSLAYEEFPVGSFRPTPDATPLLLMGLNGWNNPRLLEEGGQYIHGSVFVDAFLASSSDISNVSFVDQYTERYNRTPGVIDAVTYDATRLVLAALADDEDTRNSLRQALSRAELANPVGAGSRFGSDREVDRDLLILRIDRSGIHPWVPPQPPSDDEE